MDDPHHPGDLGARQSRRRTLAIPAFERLLQGVSHLRAEAESQREDPGRLAVGGQRVLNLFRPAREEPADHGQSSDRGASARDVTDHEPISDRPVLSMR